MNQRPFGYEPNELPGCSTPRRALIITNVFENATVLPAWSDFFGIDRTERGAFGGFGLTKDVSGWREVDNFGWSSGVVASGGAVDTSEFELFGDDRAIDAELFRAFCFGL